MSMPQYIEIAVVGATEETVSAMTAGAVLPNSGIAPRYHLLSLTIPDKGICQCFSDVNTDRVLYWVALDQESLLASQNASQHNSSRDGFSRGFYDSYLPETVVLVDDNQQFIAETRKIMEAFCATS